MIVAHRGTAIRSPNEPEINFKTNRGRRASRQLLRVLQTEHGPPCSPRGEQRGPAARTGSEDRFVNSPQERVQKGARPRFNAKPAAFDVQSIGALTRR